MNTQTETLDTGSVRPARHQGWARPDVGTVAALAVPLILWCITGIRGLTTRGTWQDEYVAWHAMTLPATDFERLLTNIDFVKVGYFVAMRLWTGVAGDSDLALRLPSVVGMAVAVVATSALGVKLFGRVSGAAAGIVLALTPAATRYGQEIQPYAWLMAFVVLSTLALVHALPTTTWWRWSLYGLALAAVGWTHVVAMMILAAHLVLYLTARGTGRTNRHWFIAAGAALVLVAPILIMGHSQSGSMSYIRMGEREIANVMSSLFMSQLVAHFVIAAAFVTTVAAFAVSRLRSPVSALLAWTVFPPIFAMITFPLLHAFLYRYFLFTLPGWALLAGAIAAPRLLDLPRLTRPLVAALVLLTVFGGGAGRAIARETPVHGQPRSTWPSMRLPPESRRAMASRTAAGALRISGRRLLLNSAVDHSTISRWMSSFKPRPLSSAGIHRRSAGCRDSAPETSTGSGS